MAPLSEFPLPPEDSSGNEPPEIRVRPPGPLSRSAAARLAKVECPAFSRRRDERAKGADSTPITLASGRGSNLYDVDGNRYVDLVAGFGSLPLGHGATALVRAMEAQTDRIIQGLGDVYAVDAKVALLERLATLHPGANPRVLLGQTGSDAVTAAIKTATLATGRPGLVAFEGAYHGLGYAPLAACGLRASFRTPFAAQLNPRVSFVPYPKTPADADRVLAALESSLAAGDAAALLIEPILGRGGCIVPPDAFVGAACEIAHRRGSLVIADEIWTGLGRTGAMTRTAKLGAKIDILCLGKALGGGLPISACIAPDDVMQAWAKEPEVVHTSTHSGAPLACAAAVATLDTLRFRQMPKRASEAGERIKASLKACLEGAPGIVEVRGEGLLFGIELASPELAAKATQALLERGYISLTGGCRGEVITWTPALTIEEELVISAGRVLRESL